MDGIEGSDTEITLGVGKLLALFFALVILCGISLSAGYTLGRNSASKAAAAADYLSKLQPTAGSGGD